MSTRLRHALRAAALALLLPASGCCTLLTWGAAPRLLPERLVGARVDEQGNLELGVESNDGRRHAYRQTGIDYVDLQLEPVESADAAKIEWPCTPDASGVIALHPTPRVLAGSVGATVRMPPAAHGSISIHGSDPDRPGYFAQLPDMGDVRWRHPGSWLVVVAMPVTVAVDVVTAPIQAIVYFLFWPRC